MSKTIPGLLFEARRCLGVPSQGALGEALGVSRRTGQRWERGHTAPMPGDLHALAKLTFPHDAELAARIATAGGSSLEGLGLVRPPPPAPPPAPPKAESPPPLPPPPPPRPDPVHLVDTVVCAAAEAMQMMPDSIRPALRAAFERARLAGLSVEDVDRGLRGPGEPPPDPAPRAPRKSAKGP